MSYVIAPKDIRLVREETGRVFRAPKGDMTRGSLHHALDLSAFMISLERAVRARGHVRVLELNEILRAQTRGVGKGIGKKAGTWKVEVLWQGKKRVLHPASDRIFSLLDERRPAERNRRHCFVEIDRGTMPVVQPFLEQTSILRKALAYSQTYSERLEETLFGMSHSRVLFVGKTPARVESVLRCFVEFKDHLATPKIFLFTDWRTIRATPDFFEVPWRRADGEVVRLLD